MAIKISKLTRTQGHFCVVKGFYGICVTRKIYLSFIILISYVNFSFKKIKKTKQKRRMSKGIFIFL